MSSGRSSVVAPVGVESAGGRLAGWVPVVAVGALTAGLMVAATGLAIGNLPLAAAAGAAAALALAALAAAGSIDGLCALAVMLPLPALLSDDYARITPAAIVTAVVLLAWFLANAPGSRRARLGRLPRRAVAGFLAAVVLATLFAQHPGAAVRELVNLGLMMALLVVATDILIRDPERIRRLALVVAAVAGLVGVVAVLQTLGLAGAEFPLVGTAFYRATAGFGWPNELGMFMAVSLPLAVYAYRSAQGTGARLAAAAALAGAGTGLAVTFSRGSWLAVAAASPVLLLVGPARLTLKLAVGAAVAAVGIDLALGGALTDRATGVFTDPYVAQRIALMLVGVLMFLDHPIVGVGPGGFAESLGEYGPRIPWLWDYVGSSHNAYLEVAAEAGILGFVAFVALLGGTLLVLLKSARRAQRRVELRRALLWSFATVCAIGFTVWPFAHGIGQLAVLVAAMGIAADADADPDPAGGPMPAGSNADGSDTAPAARRAPPPAGRA